LIGMVVSFVPVLNLAMNGYGLDVLRNTARGADVPLPKWDALSRYFTDGLKLLIIQLIYGIPTFAVTTLMIVLGFGLNVITEDMQRTVRQSMANNIGVLLLVMFCLIVIYSLLFSFIAPALQIQVARTGEIASAFRYNEILSLIKPHIGGYILVFILTTVPGAVISIVAIMLVALPALLVCLYFPIMLLVTLFAPYLILITSHWYGQLAQETNH
jgi:hypothetical protein